ncbi:MAG: hypothetical protein Q8Q88_02965 [Phenylobacterium sp.]|uniref:hypothetical protein n=1 Tax=Phenylobacterium sp. TaxID=1871053 RepID=UPI0027352A4E|nr:hypothetical protein [Phenylobacterium sp.]MDP3745989.1 hypothetical protein [Phenylobacterium sp.]
MTNWFEQNSTKSIVSYTIFVAGAVWAASTFILADNRVNLLKAQIESTSAQAEQYRVKLELLEREAATLRAQNSEYLQWLGRTENALPAIVPKVTELKAQVVGLTSEVAAYRTRNGQPAGGNTERRIKVGTADVDDLTGIVIAVLDTYADQSASVSVSVMGKVGKPTKVKAGHPFSLTTPKGQFLVSVASIAYLTDEVKFLVKPTSVPE